MEPTAEHETYRYAKTSDGWCAYRKSDGKLLGSVHRRETLKAAPATGTHIVYFAMAPGETVERTRTHKRGLAARHLDALERARTATYRRGDKVNCYFPEGHIGSGVQIERVDGEHLYIVGHRTPITRADLRVWTPEEPLPIYTA